jgi:hypothetical protein
MVGIGLATVLPGSDELSYLGLLAVLAIVVQMTQTRIAFWTVAVAGVIAVIGTNWSMGLGMIAAITAGIVVALGLERWARERLMSSGRGMQ